MSIDINKIPAGNESRDDSAISARTDNVSFAETALRLGGKTAEEARRTGVVDTADDQVEEMFAERRRTTASPIHRAVWENRVPVEEFHFDVPALGSDERKVINDCLHVARSHLRGGTLYGDDGKLSEDVLGQLADAGYSEDEWLLATDTAVVVPVGKVVVMQVTASDVIHSWTIPSFGVKQDGVPGRLAELWFQAEKEGIYFGQCSELCGKDHAYMPITVKVVSQEAYDQWLQGAIEEYAGLPQNYQVASN